ncbi:MAG: enoyl-CoA hydratase-related protein, partial [Candidatus Eremiobacteraeota bacterium]|nr:enoyl-CoA hydratase-related protein [Candidatus Eremiobacteraeota bacterium]
MLSGKFDTITVEGDGTVATITLNRPTTLNALNAQVLGELAIALAALDDNPDIRAIIITGSGAKAFAAGADIAELNALENAVDGAEKARTGQAVTLQIERMRTPVIMAVNGFALGGGCELAMAGDIRIASENAKFGQPEVNLGLIPGYGGSQRTTRLVGKGMAMYL